MGHPVSFKSLKFYNALKFCWLRPEQLKEVGVSSAELASLCQYSGTPFIHSFLQSACGSLPVSFFLRVAELCFPEMSLCPSSVHLILSCQLQCVGATSILPPVPMNHQWSNRFPIFPPLWPTSAIPPSNHFCWPNPPPPGTVDDLFLSE